MKKPSDCHCGSPAEVTHLPRWNSWRVGCLDTSCGAGLSRETEGEAVAAWDYKVAIVRDGEAPELDGLNG